MWRGLLKDYRRTRRTVRAYLLGSALLGASHAVLFSLLALYLDERGLSKRDIGLVQSAESWGKVLVAIPAALFLARRSAGPIFVGAAGTAGAAYAVLPWVDGTVAFSLVNLVGGLAFSMHYVAIAPFLFRHTGATERAGVFGLAEAVRTLAAVGGSLGSGLFVERLAPVLGGERESMAWAITAGGGLAFLGAFAFAAIPRETPSLEPGERLGPALRSHRGLLARFALPQLVIACGAGLCIPFFSLYFKDRFGFSPGRWTSLWAAGQVLMTLGFLVTPWLLARFGFVRSMLLVELGSIPFFLTLAFTQLWPLAVLAFLMRAGLMNSAHPVLKNFMMQATPPGVREVQTGINATLWGIGWVIGPYAAGRVLEATGGDYSLLMFATIAMYLAAAGLSFLLLRPIDPTWRRPGERAPAPEPGA